MDAGSAATLAQLADQVCESWHEPDAGIWELGDYSHYTISKMSCWTALNHATQLAERGQLPAEHASRWRRESETVRAWADQHCWSPSRGIYMFRADGDELGAAVLLAAGSGYLTGDDQRLPSTIDAVRTELDAGAPLLYRYRGMGDKEGAFLACSFWLVEALCTAGRLAEAEPLLDELVGLGGATGLLIEELDPDTGELRGNLPQALSHLALIGAEVLVGRSHRRAPRPA